MPTLSLGSLNISLTSHAPTVDTGFFGWGYGHDPGQTGVSFSRGSPQTVSISYNTPITVTLGTLVQDEIGDIGASSPTGAHQSYGPNATDEDGNKTYSRTSKQAIYTGPAKSTVTLPSGLPDTSGFYTGKEGTGGDGLLMGDNTIASNNTYLDVPAVMTVAEGASSTNVSFLAALLRKPGGALPSGTTGTVTIYHGYVADPDVDYRLALGSDTEKLPNGDTITVSFAPVNLSYSIDSEPITATVTLQQGTTYSIAATDASKPDGLTGTTPYSFTVTRTGDASQAATLTYVVAGSAASPAPASLFASPSGNVSFAAGETSKTVNVSVNGALLLSPQTFTVTLSGPGGTNFGTSTASGTIQPNLGLTIQNGSQIQVGIVTAGETITFASDAGKGFAPTPDDGASGAVLTLTNPTMMQGTIVGFGLGEVVTLAGVADTTGVSLSANNVLTVARSTGSPISLQFDPAQSFTGRTFEESVSNGQTNIFLAEPNVTDYSDRTDVIDSRSGNVIQTLPAVSGGSMQFLSVDGKQYGRNLASAAALGLDPSRLRDVDGNDTTQLANGSPSAWELKGIASVEIASDPSYILINPSNGRWAEVAPQPDGTFNYNDHGSGGTTRIVGIYNDPLIALGLVTKGSAVDSQTRFTADLSADRLSVLGSVDYTNDLNVPANERWETLFFKVNGDGNHADDVYLRAILHLDGNIQYANYMNAGQFTQFMTSSQTPSPVYAGWLTK